MDNFPLKSSMEILHPCRILLPLFLALLDLSFTLQDEFYINCGSSASITLGRRKFVGDANSSSFTLSPSQNHTVENQSSSTNSTPLYDTARIFTQKSWYEFDIVQNGTYIIRLHFFPFSTPDNNLVDAKFHVSAFGFSLLSNFSVSSRNKLPLVQEFLLTIKKGKFQIDFIPSGSSSMAFINAIEANVTPSDRFIPNSAAHITPLGDHGQFNGLLSNVLHVIHRINVGGPIVTPDSDALSRNWVPDDDYLLLRDAASDTPFESTQLNYRVGGATKYDAPDLVYKTAKVMNTSIATKLFNVSWRFGVSKNDRFLVRAHFCDVVSKASSEIIKFNFYIYGNYSKPIDPRDFVWTTMTAVPFYIDFIVDSDDSGFMNISIGPRKDSSDQRAYLNGLEIMKLISEADPISNGSNGTKKRLVIIIVSVVGGTLFVILSLAMFLFALRKRKEKSVENFERPLVPFLGGSSHSRTTQRNGYGSPIQVLNLGLKVPLADILFATKNFDDRLIIGEGGFGKVYKGTFKNGTKIAVKRSEPGRRQGLPEFQTEIMVLSNIRHRHLVSLIGYCDERSEMVLVYEFMEKGTLREHLYNFKGESRRPSSPTSQGGLSWEKRLQLCIDAAKGLHYLHSGLNGAVIHRDIKSTNILIDEHYVAKVADFGISRSGALDQSHVSTEVKGSFGYLDPEYYKSFQLTQKSDVYSFGVVLLEVLCARAAIDKSLPGDQVNLADWGISCIREGIFEKLIDHLLVGKINANSLRKYGETVEKCLQEYGVDRPNMVGVLWDLEYALQLQRTAVPTQLYEYSTTDVSCDLPLIVIHRLPSHSMLVSEAEERPLTPYSDTSCTSAGEVFSQLRIDEAR